MREAIERAFAQRSNQTAELSLPVPTPREVQASVIFLDPPLADGGHAIAVLSDRTRDRAVERMRADFVANASHELRTPLASLMGFIETLRGPAADDAPAQKRFLGIMAEQAERMNRLIDDLLSLSRIELTEHQPPSELVDLAEIAESIAAGFEPTAGGAPGEAGTGDRARHALHRRRCRPARPGAEQSGGQCGEIRARGRRGETACPQHHPPAGAGPRGRAWCCP